VAKQLAAARQLLVLSERASGLYRLRRCIIHLAYLLTV